MTLLLRAPEVRALIDEPELMAELRHAMREPATTVPPRRAFSPLPGANRSTMVVHPGLSSGIPAYTVKVNAKYSECSPSVVGLILLNDLDSGRPLAVLDSTVITEVRTALVGAIAADVLARRAIERVAVIGAGVQGRAQLRALRYVRRFSSVIATDIVPDNAEAFAVEQSRALGIRVIAKPTAAEAVADADVVIVATWSRTPVLTFDMLRAGTHVTAVGADEPGKAELTADLIRRSVFVCDDRDLAVEMGALAGVGLGGDAIHASLQQVLAGERPGRTDDTAISIYGSVGLPVQDVVAAWCVYRAAMDRGVGRELDFYG